MNWSYMRNCSFFTKKTVAFGGKKDPTQGRELREFSPPYDGLSLGSRKARGTGKKRTKKKGPDIAKKVGEALAREERSRQMRGKKGGIGKRLTKRRKEEKGMEI